MPRPTIRRRIRQQHPAPSAATTTILLTAACCLTAHSTAFLLPTPTRSLSTSIITTPTTTPTPLTKHYSATIDKPTTGKDTLSDDGSSSNNADIFTLLSTQYESIYNRALNGKPAQLKALFAAGATWEGLPLAENGGKDELQQALDVLDQGRAFMIDPRMTVTEARVDKANNKVEIDWQLSGTWPFPYRPRVRAAGTTVASVDVGKNKVTKMEEKWDKPWWKVALEQAAPRGWDLWHLYLTPPSEKPLYKVLKKFDALEIREYYPRVVIELETYDARPAVKFTEFAWVLPDFAFTDELKLQGKAQYRETYLTTSPIESCVESVAWQKEEGQEEVAVPAKKIRWHVPVPSHLGHDVTALPTPSRNTNATTGDAGRYVLQPRRYVAVRTFKGQTQTEEYSNARRWLLSWCQKEKLQTVRNAMGKSQVWVQQHNMKAGFNMAGHFCLGIYEQPSYSDWGEIAVEVEGDASFLGRGD